MMKRILTITFLTAISCVPAAAAGFDCAKAATTDEHLVCDVPQISLLDSLLKSAYAEAKAASPDETYRVSRGIFWRIGMPAAPIAPAFSVLTDALLCG